MYDDLKWFGNYSKDGQTPIMLIPERSSCAPYIYVPEGTYAVLTKHGAFHRVVHQGGLIWCLPWTQIQFLVTKQNVTYSFPVRACPTFDNIFVALDICVVFRCKVDESPGAWNDREKGKKNEDNIFNFCYRISINQLNEQLEAALTERIRVLIRSKTHLEVYQIKGKTNTGEMKNFLNEMFGPKGLEFLDIIITEVLLPPEVKQPLDQKAQFGSYNEMEREKYNYDLRLINDAEALQLIEQDKYQERDSINEDFQKQLTLTSRDLQVIRANATKSVAEINEQAKAEVAQIDANASLKN